MDLNADDMIISLNSDNSATRALRANISKSEERAIIDAVEQNKGYLDILSALHKCKTRNIIVDTNIYVHLLNKISDKVVCNKEQLLLFIYALLEFVPFSELSGTLQLLDFRCLAERIRGNAVREMGQAKLTNSSKLQRYFHSLKSLCDDNGFKCRKSDLEKKLDEHISSIRNSNCDNTSRIQTAVNRLAVVTWLRVQQCERSNDIRELIVNMEKYTPCGVDKTVIQIVKESKKAVAFELEGNSDIADEHLHNASCLADIYSDPLAKSLLIHDRRYVHQLRFMRRKTDDDRRQVQSECYHGLCFFSSFQTEFCTFMKRIMSLYTVHGLLKIGHNFEVDISEEVSQEDIDHSVDILTCLERCFQSGPLLEQRRKMIYFVLKARVHEFQCDIHVAKSCLSSAYSLMNDGTFFEIEGRNLSDFRSRILCS